MTNWILISSRGKKRMVKVPQPLRWKLQVLKVFWPPDTNVKLGQYTFRITEIDPFVKPPAPENSKLF